MSEHKPWSEIKHKSSESDERDLQELEMNSLAEEGCSPYSLYCIGKADARKDIGHRIEQWWVDHPDTEIGLDDLLDLMQENDR